MNKPAKYHYIWRTPLLILPINDITHTTSSLWSDNSILDTIFPASEIEISQTKWFFYKLFIIPIKQKYQTWLSRHQSTNKLLVPYSFPHDF